MKKKRRLQRSDATWLGAVGLLVLLQFWWLPGDPGTPDDTYSNTIEGKRGFFQTLEGLSAAGMLPEVTRESKKLIPDKTCTLVLLSPDRYPDDHEKEDLARFVMNGGSVVFAPNWEDPKFELMSLGIKLQPEYFYKEDTVFMGPNGTPVPVPPTLGQKAEAEPSTEDEKDSAAGETPENLTPEAEETLETPSAVAPKSADKSAAPSNTQQVVMVPQTPPPLAEDPAAEDLIDQAVNPPDLPPQNPKLSDRNKSKLTPISDFETESELVSGPVPWRTRASMHTLGRSTKVLVRSTSGTVQAASWNYGNGFVVLSASSDVFSNRAMLHPTQAELAVRLIEHAHSHHSRNYGSGPTTPIVVSEFLNASDSYTGTGVLMSPALRSGTLQLITIALLAGWFGFHRFGPATRNTTTQRRSLTESATAVGNLHFRTDSGSEVVRSYLEYMKTQLQKLFGQSIHLQDTARLAARSGLDSEVVDARIRHAIDLAGQRFTPPPEAAAAVRDLSEILNRLHGSRQDG